MTEIPMPTSDGYAGPQARSPRQGSSCCKTIGIIVVVFIIIGFIVVAMVIIPFLGGLGGTGTGYSTRTIDSYYDTDVDLYSTFYYGEFYVSSSETLTSTMPDLHFDISGDTGSDYSSVTVHTAVYECDQSTFDSLSWSDLDSYYLMGTDDTSLGSTSFINLNNYMDTYTWVIWFETENKYDTWSLDIILTLRYNW